MKTAQKRDKKKRKKKEEQKAKANKEGNILFHFLIKNYGGGYFKCFLHSFQLLYR